MSETEISLYIHDDIYIHNNNPRVIILYPGFEQTRIYHLDLTWYLYNYISKDAKTSATIKLYTVPSLHMMLSVGAEYTEQGSQFEVSRNNRERKWEMMRKKETDEGSKKEDEMGKRKRPGWEDTKGE